MVTNVGDPNGGFGELDVTIDDEAASSLPFGRDVDGSFRAESFSPDAGVGLSKFDGLDLAGTWTLTFIDHSLFPFEGDFLESWSLSGDINGPTAVPEPGTFVVFGLGLAGLGYMRRSRAA